MVLVEGEGQYSVGLISVIMIRGGRVGSGRRGDIPREELQPRRFRFTLLTPAPSPFSGERVAPLGGNEWGGVNGRATSPALPECP